jgi:membrane protein
VRHEEDSGMATNAKPVPSHKTPNTSPRLIDLRESAGDEGADRGRHADTPKEIPVLGWKDVGTRVYQKIREDNLTIVAAGMAFFSLLALAPAMVAVVSLYGLVASPADVSRHVDNLSSAMPAEAKQLVADQLTQVVSSSKAGLGVGLVIGLAIALWGASSAMQHLMVALTLANNEDETRGFVALRVRALLLTIAGTVFMIGTVLLLTVVPSWIEGAGNSVASVAVSILRWPLLIAVMLGALAALYRFAPNRDEPKWRWTSWGAAIATALWIAASIGFSLYASHFGSYNKTYGSMAAVVILMFWLYITMLCILVGAVINAELEHQTMKDTTHGRAEPMGERDAYVADTVGAPASAAADADPSPVPAAPSGSASARAAFPAPSP